MDSTTHAPRRTSCCHLTPWAVLLVLCVSLLLSARIPLSGAGPRFYDDDPLTQEPETQDASGVQPREIDLVADALLNLFTRPGDPSPDVRARDVNTSDEVPDSSWFTNRIYARPVSIAELTTGPNTTAGPASGAWTVIRPKTSGFAPGFTVRDSAGEVWFLTFDAAGSPRAASGAIAVATRLFWALGYHQVESHLSVLRPETLTIGEGVQYKVRPGRTRPFTMDDVQAVLRRAARNADGSYRVLAARQLPGKIVGGFRYHGTRSDDPNDIVPHEHRRALRALKVFGAWTNLVDLKAGNTLDTVVTENGRSRVRHYLQDVGSTFGTGAEGPHEFHEGWESLYDPDLAWRRFISLGFFLQPWQTASFDERPEIGRFEGDAFDPEQWQPRVPAAAVLRARDDDTFWAALRVMAFTDEMIRAAVKTAEFSEPASERLLGDVLIKRRDAIGRVYLPKINPVINPQLDPRGTLTFSNAAVDAGVAAAPARYVARWFSFDNATGETAALGESTESMPSLAPPDGLPGTPGAFIQIDISAEGGPQAWTRPVHAWFKRTADGWRTVGLARMPGL
jgi:hypothetical protein